MVTAFFFHDFSSTLIFQDHLTIISPSFHHCHHGKTGTSRLFQSAARCRILRGQLDDPVGAVGVHGASAIWGLAAVGLFADGELPGIKAELRDHQR